MQGRGNTLQGATESRRNRGTAFRSPAGLGLVDVERTCPNPPTGERWEALVSELRKVLPERSWELWLRPHLHPHGIRGGLLELGWNGPHVGWVRNRFGHVIERCAGRPVLIVVCDRKESA